MIIKHIVELETVINEESSDATAKAIIHMPEDERNAFFQKAGTEMIAELLTEVNKNNSWALLRVAEKESV